MKKDADVDEMFSNPKSASEIDSKDYALMLFFLIIVVVLQFFTNAVALVINCGGSVSNNFSNAALITFIPWVLVFGAIMVVLIMFPGFKCAFSNVIGYYVVAESANKLLREIMIDATVDSIETNEKIDENKKTELKKTAQSIIKIFGNVSILINQIVPGNFVEYWEMLKPLMKEEFTGDPESKQGKALLEKRKELFHLVTMRDNVGEILWLFYTGLIIIFYTQFKLSTQPCVKSPDQLAQEQDTYIATQLQMQKDADAQKETIYVT